MGITLRILGPISSAKLRFVTVDAALLQRNCNITIHTYIYVHTHTQTHARANIQDELFQYDEHIAV